MSDGKDKLRFTTLALRRTLASDHHEMSPITASTIAAYGQEDRVADELTLALSELPDEAKPTSVARFLLPDGVTLEHVEIEIARPELPGRLGRPYKITVSVVVVPEPRPDLVPAGHWVFVPAIDHACYVARGEKLADRVQAELAVLPAALALEADGWKRLLTHAPAKLERIAIELATTPLAQAHGRKALADAERKRLAIATLDNAGRRVEVSDPPPPCVGRGDVLGELSRILDGPRRSVLLVGDEAAGKTALVTAWVAAQSASAKPRSMWATSAAELV
nr:hypothetical protein [Deltaproteobacteria bacterium]